MLSSAPAGRWRRRRRRLDCSASSTPSFGIGPILMGMRAPIHVLQQGVDVTDIVNMAAYGVVDAQTRGKV